MITTEPTSQKPAVVLATPQPTGLLPPPEKSRIPPAYRTPSTVIPSVDPAVLNILEPYKNEDGTYNVTGAIEANVPNETLVAAFGEQAVTDAQTALAQHQELMAQLEPYKTADGQYDLTTALDNVSMDILNEAFGEEAVTAAITAKEEHETLMAQLEPYKTEDGQYNLTDALNAEVPRETLVAAFGEESVAEVEQSVAENEAILAAIQPYQTDEGTYNIGAALEANVDRTILVQAFGEESVAAAEQNLAQYAALMAQVDPYKIDGAFTTQSIVNALNANVSRDTLVAAFGEESVQEAEAVQPLLATLAPYAVTTPDGTVVYNLVGAIRNSQVTATELATLYPQETVDQVLAQIAETRALDAGTGAKTLEEQYQYYIGQIHQAIVEMQKLSTIPNSGVTAEDIDRMKEVLSGIQTQYRTTFNEWVANGVDPWVAGTYIKYTQVQAMSSGDLETNPVAWCQAMVQAVRDKLNAANYVTEPTTTPPDSGLTGIVITPDPQPGDLWYVPPPSGTNEVSGITIITGGALEAPTQTALMDAGIPPGSTVTVAADSPLIVTTPSGAILGYDPITLQPTFDTLSLDQASTALTTLTNDLNAEIKQFEDAVTAYEYGEANAKSYEELVAWQASLETRAEALGTQIDIYNAQVEEANQSIGENQPQGWAQALWWGITPWKEEHGETVQSYGIAKGVGVMAAEIVVPGVYAGRHWGEMSNTERGLVIALDVISLIPFIGAVGKAGRIAATAFRLTNRELAIAVKAAKVVRQTQKAMRQAITALNKTSMASKSYARIASTAQTAIQAARVADDEFLKAISIVKQATPRQLKQMERLTGFKGLASNLKKLNKAYVQLEKEWAALDKMVQAAKKLGRSDHWIMSRPGYARQLTKVQKARAQLDNVLQATNEVFGSAYHTRVKGLISGRKIIPSAQEQRVLREQLRQALRGGKKALTPEVSTMYSGVPMATTKPKFVPKLTSTPATAPGTDKWAKAWNEMFRKVEDAEMRAHRLASEAIGPRTTLNLANLTQSQVRQLLRTGEMTTHEWALWQQLQKSSRPVQTALHLAAEGSEAAKALTITKPITITGPMTRSLAAGIAHEIIEGITSMLVVRGATLPATGLTVGQIAPDGSSVRGVPVSTDIAIGEANAIGEAIATQATTILTTDFQNLTAGQVSALSATLDQTHETTASAMENLTGTFVNVSGLTEAEVQPIVRTVVEQANQAIISKAISTRTNIRGPVPPRESKPPHPVPRTRTRIRKRTRIPIPGAEGDDNEDAILTKNAGTVSWKQGFMYRTKHADGSESYSREPVPGVPALEGESSPQKSATGKGEPWDGTKIDSMGVTDAIITYIGKKPKLTFRRSRQATHRQLSTFRQ